jgi:RES domain-containing protein
MRLYRIGITKHAHDLSGMGAKMNGGRWNNKGVPCIYLSESRALSLLEYTTHTCIETMPIALSFTTLEVPEHSLRQLSVQELPATWLQRPHCRHSRELGSSLLAETKHLLLKFPSAIVHDEFDFLLNVQHPLICSVKILDVTSFKL